MEGATPPVDVPAGRARSEAGFPGTVGEIPRSTQVARRPGPTRLPHKRLRRIAARLLRAGGARAAAPARDQRRRAWSAKAAASEQDHRAETGRRPARPRVPFDAEARAAGPHGIELRSKPSQTGGVRASHYPRRPAPGRRCFFRAPATRAGLRPFGMFEAVVSSSCPTGPGFRDCADLPLPR